GFADLRLATRPRDQIYKINTDLFEIIFKVVRIVKNIFVIRGGLFTPLEAEFMNSPDFIRLGSNRRKRFFPDSSGPSPVCRFTCRRHGRQALGFTSLWLARNHILSFGMQS
ncbi:MAG: hypothetical protein JXB24_14620, partial [Bacteroidales bacterium]|nr:hypothetical protein [Bacteroidales bacterium]